ncbi:MAG: AraC family transcriptional regulator [Spirochaetota bacterium]
MDWANRMKQAIEYFESHLERQADMERAARLANCSLFHFCRMFEVVFGLSPAEYLRRRRLSAAALDLAAGKDKVIDVALRYGWESPESFAKAFKRLFGITPSEARSASVPLELWPPIELTVILKGDRSMKYRIEQRDAMEFAGLVLRTTSTGGVNLKAIPQFWQEKAKDGSVERLAQYCGLMGMLGICYDYKPEDNSFAYAIAVERGSHSLKDLPQGCLLVQLPPATYAVFECRGPMPQAIQDLWKQIYTDWFPASEYEHAGTPDFEVYPAQEDPAITDSSPNYRSEVWIPIKKKAKG